MCIDPEMLDYDRTPSRVKIALNLCYPLTTSNREPDMVTLLHMDSVGQVQKLVSFCAPASVAAKW